MDLAVKISGSLDLELQLITMDFDQLFTSCLQGEVDGILGVAYTSDREERLFASEPYMSEEVEGEPMNIVFMPKAALLWKSSIPFCSPIKKMGLMRLG